MRFSLPFRATSWAIFLSIVLCVSFFLGKVYHIWFITLAVHPHDIWLTWNFPSLVTFWLVSNESVTHWLFILVLFIFEKLVRDCWSKCEVVLFIVFVNFSSVIILLLAVSILWSDSHVVISGNAALIAAVSVISTQLDAERYLLGYGETGLKSRYGVVVGLLFFLFCAVTSIVSWSTFFMYVNGFMLSWFYLRFIQRHPQRRSGDHRSSFAFAKFFPGPLEHWVAVPSNLLYQAILRTKLCPVFERQSEVISTASFTVAVPGLKADADRHRRIALKALNERLFSQSTEQGGTVDWPNLDEPDTTNMPSLPTTVHENAEVHSVVVDLTAISSGDLSPSKQSEPQVN